MEKIKRIVDGEEVEVEVARIFEKDEDFNKVVKSETSKAKGEILQALGVTSVEDAKGRMSDKTQVEMLSQKMETLEKENLTMRNRQTAAEVGVKAEMIDKVIILANAVKTDDKDFKQVIREEAEAIGALKKESDDDTSSSTRTTITKVIGTPKSKEEIALAKAEEDEMERFRKLDPLERV